MLAFLPCVHATEDTLGHVIYFAMNFDQLEPHRISIHAVHRLLVDGPLKTEVQACIDNADLRYVAALEGKTSYARRIRLTSSRGDAPNSRLYSRLNWEGLS